MGGVGGNLRGVNPLLCVVHPCGKPCLVQVKHLFPILSMMPKCSESADLAAHDVKGLIAYVHLPLGCLIPESIMNVIITRLPCLSPLAPPPPLSPSNFCVCYLNKTAIFTPSSIFGVLSKTKSIIPESYVVDQSKYRSLQGSLRDEISPLQVLREGINCEELVLVLCQWTDSREWSIHVLYE